MLTSVSTSSWVDLVYRRTLNGMTTRGGIAAQRLKQRTRVWSTFLKLVDIWPQQATVIIRLCAIHLESMLYK